ncbi:15606_t:CDS:1, partial [Funneliformis caledonium]
NFMHKDRSGRLNLRHNISVFLKSFSNKTMEQNNPSYHSLQNDFSFQSSNFARFKTNFNPSKVVQMENIPLNISNFYSQTVVQNHPASYNNSQSKS